jgi:hypothetical protein
VRGFEDGLFVNLRIDFVCGFEGAVGIWRVGNGESVGVSNSVWRVIFLELN